MPITFNGHVSACAASARRTAAIAVLALLGASAPALAVSTADLVALAKAGLSDEVLIALVEADDTVFALDAPRILDLRREGLSERVILAMIRNGRRAAPVGADPAALEPAQAPEPPPLVVIGEPAPVAQTSVIVVPYVPFVVTPGGRHAHRPARHAPPPDPGFGRFMNDGWVDGRPPFGPR